MFDTLEDSYKAGKYIVFEQADEEVGISGVLWVGSSTSREAAVDFVVYDDGELHTRLISDFQDDYEDCEECTDDDKRVSYTTVVKFEGGLPEQATVEKHGERVTVSPND